MEVLLENPKYIVVIIIIFIGLIGLIYFLLNSGTKYKLEGDYFLHPMKFISCKVNKSKKKNEFNINFSTNRKLINYKDLQEVRKKHENVENKTGKFKMTGEITSFGNELIYTENGKNYNGVQLLKDYNIYAKENDILILLNEETRESMVFKKMDI